MLASQKKVKALFISPTSESNHKVEFRDEVFTCTALENSYYSGTSSFLDDLRSNLIVPNNTQQLFGVNFAGLNLREANDIDKSEFQRKLERFGGKVRMKKKAGG